MERPCSFSPPRQIHRLRHRTHNICFPNPNSEQSSHNWRSWIFRLPKCLRHLCVLKAARENHSKTLHLMSSSVSQLRSIKYSPVLCATNSPCPFINPLGNARVSLSIISQSILLICSHPNPKPVRSPGSKHSPNY